MKSNFVLVITSSPFDRATVAFTYVNQYSWSVDPQCCVKIEFCLLNSLGSLGLSVYFFVTA